jgi:hypothetical protein
MIKDGSISESGTYKQLLERKGDFAEFLINHINEAEEEIDNEDLEMIEDIVKRERHLSVSSIDSIDMYIIYIHIHIKISNTIQMVYIIAILYTILFQQNKNDK